MKRICRQAFLCLTGLAAFALQAHVIYGQNTPTTGDNKPIALLPGFDKQLMDTSADACSNFAQYACGNFAKLYPIPPDLPSYGSFFIVFEHTEGVVHQMLDKVADKSAQHTANEQKIGDYYASCMDEDAVHAEGLKPLQPELDRIAALTDKKQLTQLLVHYTMINVNAFFNYGEQQDLTDATKQIAFVDQAGIGLPERDYYFRTDDAAVKTRKEYVDHIGNMLKLMGEPADQAATDAQKIMTLETALAKASMDVTSRRDPHATYHVMTIAKLGELAPSIDWTPFIAATGVSGIADLNVASPDFFKGMQAVIDSTDLDTIKAYLRWQLINSIPSYAMPKAMDEENFDFNGRKLTGQQEQRARWKRCTEATENALGEAVGEVYVASQFPPSSKTFTLQMVHDIEAAMGHEIDNQAWMSDETQAKARTKLQMVANKIGYPDRWRDYTKLDVVRGDALGNAFKAVEFENKRELAKIGQPLDRAEWITTPETVNAFYNPALNDINFPAAILQAPLYDPQAGDSENYGHIGAVVGHELTHGFDDQGSQFDGNGNLANWWTPDDRKKFDDMTDCEVKEYGNFTAVDDVKVNGKLTLGENTADNGGIRLAYSAFLDDAKRKGIDLSAKQDGFDGIQQFFLAFAQTWCSNDRPEMIRLAVQTDAHSPEVFRINGVVQNMQEFGKAFGCKAGQPMMPVNACHVW
jgi:endothelin-converting enzyme/putative endopeptidase